MKNRISRPIVGTAIAAALAVLPVGAAFADDDGSGEAYPPASTAPPVTPTTVAIPSTGNEGTGTWVTLGAGAVLAGGLMVAGTTRRRKEADAS